MSGIPQVANGLLRGYLMDQNLQRQKQQDQQQEARGTREAAQAERQATMDGLTIRKRQGEAEEYEAGADVRAGKQSAERQALADQERERLYNDSLLTANKQFQTSGKLDGFVNHYNSMVDDGQKATGMVMDEKTGRVDVQLTDDSGQTWTRSFDNMGALTQRLDELRSPEAIRAAQAAKEAERRKATEEQRTEDKDNRRAKRDHGYSVEMEGLRAGTQERLLQLREKIGAGKTGRMISQADRGKLILQTAEDLADDPSYAGKSHEERVDAAKGIVNSLYENGDDEAPDTPAADGITRPAPAPKPKPSAGKPAAFKTQSGATMTQEQYVQIVRKAKAANPGSDPAVVENAVRQRYGFPSL